MAAPRWLSPDPLSAIGTALLARLQQGLPATLFHYRVMPARLTPAAWNELTARTPFVGLGWNHIAPAPDLARSWRGVSRWTVYLVARNASGEQGRYFGDAQGVGLLAMVTAATAILHGADIAGLGTARVEASNNAVAEGWEPGHAVIAALDVEVPLDLSIAALIDGASLDIDPFITDAIDWSLVDGAIALSDTITLPQL